MRKFIHIFGGGTFSHVRSHLALAAPAFGSTARTLAEMFSGNDNNEIFREFTKMADQNSIMVTNEDVERRVDQLIADPKTDVIIFNVALCDFHGEIGHIPSGKYSERLQSRAGPYTMHMTMADKIIGKIRKHRKDIFVVGFKTTAGADSNKQYLAALNMLKENSLNLVFANDVVTRNNMIVAPEETRYSETDSRETALANLVHMVEDRSSNTFTRSTIIPGDTVDWNSPEISETLRTVVNHCIRRGAYKPFRGSTAGHFAQKVSANEILTSKRKTNYNNIDGLVRVTYDGFDKVIAHGFKPSVGGQSQRIVFDEHPDLDCIVHFHSPLKKHVGRQFIPVASQSPYECGSHQCGANTSKHLRDFGNNIHAVMLDNHGPNIVFKKDADPMEVISFIERNFDLDQKTGGLVS